jgi:hypothetical protein
MPDVTKTINALKRLSHNYVDTFALISFGTQHALYLALMDKSRRMTSADCTLATTLSLKDLQMLAGVRLLSASNYLADVAILRLLYPDKNVTINKRLERLKNKGLLASAGRAAWHITIDGNRVLSAYADNCERLVRKYAPHLLKHIDPSVFGMIQRPS